MENLKVKSMNIDLSLDKNIITIMGPSNSGKTYFLKKMINIIPNEDVLLDGISIKEYDITYLKNNIGCFR